MVQIVGIEKCYIQITKLAICVEPWTKDHRCAKCNVDRYMVFSWNRN